MTVFGYLILISIDFFQFYFSVFSLVLDSIEKIYKAFETVFYHISKHLEVRPKYSFASRIFNSTRCLDIPDETLSLVFDILHEICKFRFLDLAKI